VIVRETPDRYCEPLVGCPRGALKLSSQLSPPANARRPPPVRHQDHTFADIEPPIWRRILLPRELNFAQLHEGIQAAFGWTDSHLHHFVVGGPRRRRPRVRRRTSSVTERSWRQPRSPCAISTSITCPIRASCTNTTSVTPGCTGLSSTHRCRPRTASNTRYASTVLATTRKFVCDRSPPAGR
jgi:hypothetical protein